MENTKIDSNILKDALVTLENITYCSYIGDSLKELLGISKARTKVQIGVCITIDNDHNLVFSFYDDEYDDYYYIGVNRVISYLVNNHNLYIEGL